MKRARTKTRRQHGQREVDPHSELELAAINAVWALIGSRTRLSFVQTLIPAIAAPLPAAFSLGGVKTARLPRPPDAPATTEQGIDILHFFVGECIVVAPGERVQSADMHTLFCAWAKSRGVAAWTAKRLSLALQFRGFRSIRSSVVYWMDCRLAKSVGDYRADPHRHEAK